jgi:hypothetical protein
MPQATRLPYVLARPPLRRGLGARQGVLLAAGGHEGWEDAPSVAIVENLRLRVPLTH